MAIIGVFRDEASLPVKQLVDAETMPNPPSRNTTRIKPTPKAKTTLTRANAAQLPPPVSVIGVSDTSNEQENIPPLPHPMATPRTRAVRNSSPLSTQRTPLRTSSTPLRTSSTAANCRNAGGHVTTQPANIQTMSSQLKDLQGQLNALNRERAKKEQLKAALSSQPTSHREAEHDQPDDRVRELEAELQKERALVTRLRTQAASSRQNDESMNSSTESMIPRPRGVARKDYSVQVEMGLATSERNNQKYSTLLRDLRDLVLRSQINWELPWADIPASEKAKLFNVARERHPILARYVNDWATADIVRCYMKNKRSHHYKNGWLDVPDKYSHLKKNSSQRNPNASRTKRAKAVLAAKKRRDKRSTAHVGAADKGPMAGSDMDVDINGFGGEEEEVVEVEVEGDEDDDIYQ